MLSSKETAQVVQIITNLDEKNKKVPYYSDLENHMIFGKFFVDLDPEQKLEVKEIIN